MSHPSSSSSAPAAAVVPAELYAERLARYTAEALVWERRAHRLSNWRLLIFLAGVGGTIWSVVAGWAVAALLFMGVGLVAFIAVVMRHHRYIQTWERVLRLVKINQEGLDRLSGQWRQRSLRGDRFVDREHACSSDLDLFGPHSVFQWCSTARTWAGQEALADLLRQPAPPDQITPRQAAIAELAQKLDWRQELEAEAMAMEERRLDGFCQWLEGRGLTWLDRPWPRWLCHWPWLTVLVWGVAWMLRQDALAAIAVTVLAIQVATALLLSKALHARLSTWLKWETEASAIFTLLQVVERESFTAPLNQKLQSALHEQGTDTDPAAGAGESFRELETILGRIALRQNPLVHFFVNGALLWDLRGALAVEQWRRRHGLRVREWLAAFTQVEALCSLAVIPFDQPGWVFPTVQPEGTALAAKALGHPLLAATERVSNDFSMEYSGSAAIITGSNMSGKSTFLRTVGVNLALAYAGAPVCAQAFRCGVWPLYTSMRIADDLSRGVSSFYAELLRIKRIVDAARQGPILYLIDEIFRGTNSGDRIAGAIEVLRVLTAGRSLGLVSTHDLELSKLADTAPEHFQNYHFSEYYTEDRIEFSYQIQPGPATTTNAQHLIRMVGIVS